MASFSTFTVNVDEATVLTTLAIRGKETRSSLPSWAEYVAEHAHLVCPHAKEETLTQYEIDLGLGTPVVAGSMPELLRTEYEWFNKTKIRNGGGRLTLQGFKSFGFCLVMAVLQNVFSHNPELLVELLKVPLRAEFVEAEDLTDLFVFRGQSLITTEKMHRLLKMLRRDLDGSMPMDQYRALLAKQRLEKVRAEDPHREVHKRGHYIGLEALHKPFPLAGRVAGEGHATAVVKPFTQQRTPRPQRPQRQQRRNSATPLMTI